MRKKKLCQMQECIHYVHYELPVEYYDRFWLHRGTHTCARDLEARNKIMTATGKTPATYQMIFISLRRRKGAHMKRRRQVET